jgi:MFS family permease
MRRLFPFVATVVLVDTAFYAAISPLLPHYSDELGLSKAAAGALSASYAAGTLAGALPSGLLAQRAGVRRTVLAGLALLGGSSLGFAFAERVELLDAARFLQGVGGAMMWAGGLSWLVLESDEENRGALLGSALAAAIGGIMIGPVLGGAATATSPQLVFSLVAVAAGGLAVQALRLPAPPAAGAAAGIPLLAALRDRRVVAGLWLMTLPALFSGTFGVLVPLRLDDLGASGVAIGAIFLGLAVVEAVLSPILGRVSDRRGRLVPMRAGLAAAVAGAALLAVPDAIAPLVAVTVLAIAALAAFWAPAMAMLSDAADAVGLDQGYAFALTNLGWAGGQVLGAGAGGGLAQASADAVPYAILSVLCLGTLAGLKLILGRSYGQFGQGRVPSAR